MSATANAGAEEHRVVFRIPRDAAGNVAQPDMSLDDILSGGEMYPIQAFVADMKAGLLSSYKTALSLSGDAILVGLLSQRLSALELAAPVALPRPGDLLSARSALRLWQRQG